MKIVFNLIIAGCGNNGGTRTVLLSAQALESLGHNCNVVARVDNFTWFPHKAVINHIPNDTEVIINASAADYEVTRRSNVPRKYAWWRAHESWSNTEDYLRNCYLDKEVKNIVNSVGLQNRLKSYGAESCVIYQGVDLDLWNDLNLRPKDKIRIGCLHTKQPRKRWKDFVELAKILGPDKYEYVAMGSANPENCSFLTEFKLNAGVDELNNLYSSCHIWFAPTENEGLHNVPMEAALCGCLIICSDYPMNGMILDYAFDDTTMVYKFGNLDEAASLIRNPNWKVIDKMYDCLKIHIGTREDNMKKLVGCLENI